jgi:hypothetical protein
VTAQATHGKSKQVALDECIGFELLAQEADTRGLAKDPEVVDATRSALVNRLVETGFEDRYQTPADLADVMKAHIDRNRARLKAPELRSSAYVRFNLPPKAPPDQDAKARELIEGFAAKIANEEGLTAAHLDDLAKAHFGTATKVEVAVVEHFPKLGLALGYRDALFDIPEVGRTHPNAVRTQWGWDTILLTGIRPAMTYTPEEAATEAFPEVRRGYFTFWVDQIAKSLGVRITLDEKAIARLDDEIKPEAKP